MLRPANMLGNPPPRTRPARALEARFLALTQEGLRPGWFPGNLSSTGWPTLGA